MNDIDTIVVSYWIYFYFCQFSSLEKEIEQYSSYHKDNYLLNIILQTIFYILFKIINTHENLRHNIS
jgi:hypothetical protein